MGLFSLFKPRPAAIASFHIQFPDDFEDTWNVAVMMSGGLRDGTEIWVWDLYYAKMLYNLGGGAIADGLKKHLETWCTQRAYLFWSGLPVPDEALTIDTDLVLSANPIPNSEVYQLDVLLRDGEWPIIQTYLPSKGFQNRTACSVMALAQYFVDHKSFPFLRDFCLHVPAMAKYYSEVKPYTQLGSVFGAPAHALKSVGEFYRDQSKS